MARWALVLAAILAAAAVRPCGAGQSLKKLRHKLKDESYSEPLKRTEAEAAVQFEGRHRKVTNIILVHQDLVGAAVPLQILRRYLRENDSRGVMAEQKEQRVMKVWYKRATFQRIQALDPVPNACWVTLLRDPHQRALSLYLHAATRLLPARVRASAQQLGPGLRTDDDTQAAQHGGPLLHGFVRQDPAALARWPQLKYVPQWTSFAESPAAAEAVLRKHDVLLGTSDRMDEFLVMLRHRLGWLDVRGVLYADLRPQAHEQGGVLAHAHGKAATAMDPALFAALSLQPSMASELDFWQRAKAYYVEQARGFGMGRLEAEAESLTRTLQALHQHCAGQVMSSGGGVGGKQPEVAATAARGRDGWGGFGAWGGFGTFGANGGQPKADKARRVKSPQGRRRLLSSNAPARGRLEAAARAPRQARRRGGSNAEANATVGARPRRRWHGLELRGGGGADESFLLPFMAASFDPERDDGSGFGGGAKPASSRGGERSAPVYHEGWSVGPDPKRWAEPEPEGGFGGENSRRSSRKGGLRGTSSSGDARPPPTYAVQTWSRPLADWPAAETASAGDAGTAQLRPKPLVRRSAAAASQALQYGDGDLKGLSRSVPAPRAFDRCSTLRSGLVTGCEQAVADDRLEFTTQCMLHQWDACRKRPELRSAACA